MTAQESLGYIGPARFIQVILTVLQLGFTETFEHIDHLLTLYIMLLSVPKPSSMKALEHRNT